MSSAVATRPVAFTARTRNARRAGRARSRAAVWGEIIALAVIVVALIAATVLSSGRPAAPVPSQRVRVERGQTLWELASQHPVSGLTTEQTADAIARLNDLDGGRLAAGASVRVPVEGGNDFLIACR